jgi:hypothetical protein
MSRSITPADYDALLALDQPAAPPSLPQHLLGALARPRGGAPTHSRCGKVANRRDVGRLVPHAPTSD